MDLKKSDTATTQGSGWSQDESNPSSSRDNNSNSVPTGTPKKLADALLPISVFTPKRGKLMDAFGKNGRPSLPKNNDGTVVDMDIADVGKRMNQLGYVVALLSADTYGKLSWIIGKELDRTIIQRKGRILSRVTLAKILNPSTDVGKRFDAIYRSDGDKTFDSEGMVCPVEFMKERLGVDPSSESTYTIYDDPDHENVEYFCREQAWGNCHTQGPILVHWLLSLWHDKEKKAADVRMIHMSKYFRNALPNADLYNYIVEEGGDCSFKRARRIMPEAFRRGCSLDCGPLEFEEVVEMLKKRGPALVEMDDLNQDFQEEGKVEYSGIPPKGSKKLESGHGMLLVGVCKDPNVHPAASNPMSQCKFSPNDNLGTPQTQVHLLFQNWWPGKPFMKVRMDYFMNCSGCLIFSNGNKVNEVTSDSYASKTNGVRRAVTAAAMEKGNFRPKVKR